MNSRSAHLPFPGPPPASAEQHDYVANRHDGGGNVAFCDAHVEYGKQTNWMRPVISARLRWNNDHQPHPETWH